MKRRSAANLPKQSRWTSTKSCWPSSPISQRWTTPERFLNQKSNNSMPFWLTRRANWISAWNRERSTAKRSPKLQELASAFISSNNLRSSKNTTKTKYSKMSIMRVQSKKKNSQGINQMRYRHNQQTWPSFEFSRTKSCTVASWRNEMTRSLSSTERSKAWFKATMKISSKTQSSWCKQRTAVHSRWASFPWTLPWVSCWPLATNPSQSKMTVQLCVETIKMDNWTSRASAPADWTIYCTRKQSRPCSRTQGTTRLHRKSTRTNLGKSCSQTTSWRILRPKMRPWASPHRK